MKKIFPLIAIGLSIFGCTKNNIKEVSSYEAYCFVQKKYTNYGWRSSKKMTAKWDMSKSYGLGIDYAILQIRSTLKDDSIKDLKGEKTFTNKESLALNEGNFYEICPPSKAGASYFIDNDQLIYEASAPVIVSASSQFAVKAHMLFNADGFIKYDKYNYPGTNIYSESLASGYIDGFIEVSHEY